MAKNRILPVNIRVEQEPQKKEEFWDNFNLEEFLRRATQAGEIIKKKDVDSGADTE